MVGPECSSTVERKKFERRRKSVRSFSRELKCRDVDVDKLLTIEMLNDEFDLIADRDLRTGEILGLDEVKKSLENIS